MEITHFDVLRGPFVDLGRVLSRVFKIMQKYAKMHIKSSQNEHEKIWYRVLQLSKRHAVASAANMHQNAFILVVPGVALVTPWMEKSFKIVEN